MCGLLCLASFASHNVFKVHSWQFKFKFNEINFQFFSHTGHVSSAQWPHVAFSSHLGRIARKRSRCDRKFSGTGPLQYPRWTVRTAGEGGMWAGRPCWAAPLPTRLPWTHSPLSVPESHNEIHQRFLTISKALVKIMVCPGICLSGDAGLSSLLPAGEELLPVYSHLRLLLAPTHDSD